MRKAIAMTVWCLCVLSGTWAMVSAASARDAVSRGASTSVGDSQSGVLVECTDFRGGHALAFPAQRIRADGSIGHTDLERYTYDANGNRLMRRPGAITDYAVATSDSDVSRSSRQATPIRA